MVLVLSWNWQSWTHIVVIFMNTDFRFCYVVKLLVIFVLCGERVLTLRMSHAGIPALRKLPCGVARRYTGGTLCHYVQSFGDYGLPVVTGWAEPQEGGGIAWAWIDEPKVYPGIPMPQWWRWVPKGTVVATGGRFVKIFGFLLLILAKLCWLTRKFWHGDRVW